MYDGRILSSQHTSLLRSSEYGSGPQEEQGLHFPLPWAMNIFTAGSLSPCSAHSPGLTLLLPVPLMELQTMTGIKWCLSLVTLQLLAFWSPISFAVEMSCFLPWRKHGREMCSLHSCPPAKCLLFFAGKHEVRSLSQKRKSWG